MAKGGSSVAFGDFGLATLEPAWITSRQIEAARRAMTRSVKRGGKIWIRVFPDKPATKKPAETRMGSGKGAPDHWVAVVKPGRILFEMARRCPQTEALEAMRLASHKLPVATHVVVREGAELEATGWTSIRFASCPIPSSSWPSARPSRTSGRRASPLSTRQLKDYSTIPQTRHTIARILTVQHERKLGRDGLTGDHAMTGAPVNAKRKTKVGRVVSDKMDKTIVVSVERLARHPLYKRVIRLSTKFKAHDETNAAHVGDTVLIEESRPLSATKRWRLVEIVAARRRARRRRRRASRKRPRPRPSTAPPTPAATADAATDRAGGGRGVIQESDPPQGRRQHRRPDDRVHPDHGPLAQAHGRVGDVIVAAVKQAIPNAAVKKGDVVRAVIVRTTKEYGRPDGSYIRFDENAAVLINNQGNPARHPDLRPGRPRAA